MRIAHIANFYGPTSGGLRTTMHALGRGYTERGHDYLMIVPGKTSTDEMTEFGRRVTLHAPLVPLSGGYRVISRPRRVKNLLKEFHPDVIEVSDRTTLRSIGTWAHNRGIPSVFFAHERADGVLGANLPPSLAEAEAVEAVADWHNRGTARRFSTVVATTDFAAEEFRRIGVPVRKISLGVDLDLFGPEHSSAEVRAEYANPDEELLLMASRLSPEKRPDLAIDAVRALVARGRSVRLVSAGTGSLRKEMEELAEGLPVTFLGFVGDRERFSSLLAAADAVVAPGPIETFGLAALEALASGTPVVVNANSALPEVIGPAGASADSRPIAFADAIETLLDTPPDERRAVARARAESMPWSQTVEAMLRLHREGSAGAALAS